MHPKNIDHMNDRDIYIEISKILYGCTPNPSEQTQVHVDYWPKQSVGYMLWCGEYLTREGCFSLPRDVSRELTGLIYKLGEYFSDHNMGEWNMMHFILAPEGKSFSVNFEFNQELYDGNLRLYKYRNKFKKPENA